MFGRQFKHHHSDQVQRQHLLPALDEGVTWRQIQMSLSESRYGREIYSRVQRHMHIDEDIDALSRAYDEFLAYKHELQRIRETYKASRQGISEEELFMSVLGGSVKDRRRKEYVANIKEETSWLVQQHRSSIATPDADLEDDEADLCVLKNAFFAWATGLYAGSIFGSTSYHFIALDVLLKTVRNLERAGHSI